MRRRITALCREPDADPVVRAVVFTGAGEGAFGAGQDLREPRLSHIDHVDAWVEEWRAFFSALRGLGKLNIAAVNGVAAGSSFQFALLTDIRIGHPGTRMGQPEIRSRSRAAWGPGSSGR